MKAQLAFYKGKGDLTDKAIRWWTKSNYSHVELIVFGMWYSTSPRDLKVRRKYITPNRDNWDYVEVELDFEYFTRLFEKTRGSRYDWTGIVLSQFLPLGIHNRKRWFCSEFCSEALKLKDSNEYSPQKLYEEVA